MITKTAIMISTLEALGDLEKASRNLRLARREIEASVLEKISDLIIEELDPDEAESASEIVTGSSEFGFLTADTPTKPMTQSEKIQIRRQMKMHKPRSKIWTCCTKPKRQMTHGKTHKPMWMSTCEYKLLSGKLRGQIRSIKLVVGRGPKAPRQVIRKGKRLRWCT
jgi:hypothetical protein